MAHILMHHGENRSQVYRTIFQVLWFGKNVGNEGGKVPTYLFPTDLLEYVRQRFTEPASGTRDKEYSYGMTNCYSIAWADLERARWPSPPKSCHNGVSRPKPY
jgi:hypothetical protein